MAQERLRGWLTSVCHVPTPTPTWSGGAVPLAICSAAARFTGASRWRRPPWLSTPSGSLAGAAVLSICGAGRRTGPPGRRGRRFGLSVGKQRSAVRGRRRHTDGEVVRAHGVHTEDDAIVPHLVHSRAKARRCR